jgi:hypothetical protein
MEVITAMSDISSLVEGLSQGLNGYLQAGNQQKRQQQNFAFQQGQEQQTHAVEGQNDLDRAGKVTPDMAEQLIPGSSKWINSFQQQNGRLPTIAETKDGLDSVVEKLTANKDKEKASAEKQRLTALQKAQTGYTSNIKTEQAALESANTAEDQVHLAISNPVANSSVPITLARMMTGSSRINVNEIQRLGGSQAISDRAQQFAKQLADGTITPENAAWMEDMVSTLKKSHQQNIEDLGVAHASQYRRLSGQPLEDAYLDVVGNKIPDRYLQKPSERVPGVAKDVEAKKAALRAKLGI